MFVTEKFFLSILAMCIACGMSTSVTADTYSWDGGSAIDSRWSSVTNWSTDVAPVSASNTVVTMEGQLRRDSTNDFSSPFLLNRLEFINDSSSGSNPGFVVRGAKLKFVKDGDTQPYFYSNRQGGNYIYSDIEIPAGTTLEMNFTTYGVNFYGVISGEGGIDRIACDGGIDNLANGNNSFSGGLTVRGTDKNWQRVNVTASGAMGTGPVNLYGGTLSTSYANPGGLVFKGTTTHTNDFYVYEDSPVFAGYPTGSDVVTLEGDMALGASTVWLRGGGSGEISGAVSGEGPAAFKKVDGGTWTLSGANTFTGSVTITDGTLALGSASALEPAVSVTIEGGSTYDLGGFTVTNGAVALDSGIIKNGTLAAASYAVTDSGYVSASLSGFAGLVKSGTGTLTLRDKHTFTGDLVVEEGVVEVEPEPAPGSALWLDAANLESMAKNSNGSGGTPSQGDYVRYWKSQSSDMWVSGDNPPTYQTNVVNGLPALYFAADTLGFSTNIPAQESTAFIVYLYDNPTGHWKNPIDCANDGSGQAYLHMINNLDNRCLTRGGGAIVINSPHSATNWAVQTVQMHAGDYRLWVNEDEYGPHTSTLGFYPFGAISAGSINGYFCEVLIYTNEISAVDRTNTIRYLRRKWLGEGEFPAVESQLASGISADVRSDALLDLYGGVQSLSDLKGSGKLTNSLVTVTGVLTPGDSETTADTLSIVGDLTLADGAECSFDYVSSTPDTVAVTGNLNVEGVNTLQVSLHGQDAPEEMVLFTFGSISGEEYLSDWIISGDDLKPYSTHVKRVGNTLVMTAHTSGTLILLR